MLGTLILALTKCWDIDLDQVSTLDLNVLLDDVIDNIVDFEQFL